MATRTDDPTSTMNSGTTASDNGTSSAIGGAASDAAGAVRGVAADAVSRLPDVAATTRSAIEDANRQMRAGSDEMLAVGTILSFGFAMGLLIGGATRILVAAALVPAAAMGLTMLDRSSRSRAAAVGTRRVQGA
jgi:hypothetical protein